MCGQETDGPVDGSVYVLEDRYAVWATREKQWKTGKYYKQKSPQADKREDSIFNTGVNGGREVDKPNEEKPQ